MEQWRDIEGYEGIYQVNDIGKVRNSCTRKGSFANRILKSCKSKNGYLTYCLSKNGRFNLRETA